MMNLRRTLTSISLASLAVAAFMAIAATGASAHPNPWCVEVEEHGTGNYATKEDCETGKNKGTGSRWIRITKLETALPERKWCAKVEEPGTGQWNNNICSELGGGKEYVKVIVPELFVKGVKETTGTSHNVNTKIKSATFVLKGSIGATAVTLTSTEVKSSEAKIFGTVPATDSAKAIIFTSVKVTSPSTCTGDMVKSRTEPGGTVTPNGEVTTKAVSTEGEYFEGGSGVADVFKPTSGNIFVEIELIKAGTCPISTGFYEVTGQEAGEELNPATEELHKTLKFPVVSLSTLEFDGKTASLEGEAELTLSPEEVFTVK